jgi:hypothetical protein
MRRAALLTLLLCGAIAAPALAHTGNPDFESVVTAIDGVPGLKAQVLNGDDRLLLINTGRRTVTVQGYDGEPYARLRADRVVEVNQHSPARYLNDDRFGQVEVPASASAKASPLWEPVARDGRFEFHDHRIHWMSKTDPPQVRDDRSGRRKVSDWTVPVRTAGASAGAIRGTLWWRGTGGGAPAAMFVGLAAFALLSAAFVVVVRRRRAAATHPVAVGSSPKDEAW